MQGQGLAGRVRGTHRATAVMASCRREGKLLSLLPPRPPLTTDLDHSDCIWLLSVIVIAAVVPIVYRARRFRCLMVLLVHAFGGGNGSVAGAATALGSSFASNDFIRRIRGVKGYWSAAMFSRISAARSSSVGFGSAIALDMDRAQPGTSWQKRRG